MEEKEQEDQLLTQESQMCMYGDTGARRVVPERMCICEGDGVPEERKHKVCVQRGKWEREGNKQRTPKCCLWKCVVFQRTVRLCRGSESLFYLLKSPPELSIELLQLRLLMFQPGNCSLQRFQPLLPFCHSLLGIQRGDYVSWCHIKVRRARINTSGRVTGLRNGQC